MLFRSLGLIFLKFADNNYRRHESDIIAEYQKLKGTRREKKLSDIAIEKCGFYLPDHARYEHLLKLPEEKDIAKALKEAMKAIEEYKPELEGVLPKDEYFRLTRDEKTKNIPNQLLKNFANIPADFSATCSVRFTNTSSPSLPETKDQRAASFSRRVR